MARVAVRNPHTRGWSKNLAACTATAIWLIAACPGLGARSAAAAQAPAPPAKPATSSYRTEFLKHVDYYQQRFVSLAEAIPAEKYTWAPGEGVRSISQVFLHVTHRNFTQPAIVGAPPPPDLAARNYGFIVGRIEADRSNIEAYVRQLTGEGIVETSTNDKAKVVAALKQSFVHFRQAIERLSDADGDKPVPWLGQNTYRGMGMFWARHLGEHLGQAIAYTRMNGIVPPWTAEQERRKASGKEGRP